MLAENNVNGPHMLFSFRGFCIFVSTLLYFSCSGCLPLRFNTSPGASGVVLDADRQAPIAGADVVVSQMIYPPPSADEAFTNNRPPVVTTDIDGHFTIPPEKRWDIFVIPIDVFPRFGLLVVKCDGYESLAIPFWSRTVLDIGDIAMKPVKK
jgi:hypothetical protein